MSMLNKPTLLLGILIGIVISGIYFSPETTKNVAEIIQIIVICAATIFTAWWTSKTFGHDLKSQEAKEIIGILHQMRECIPNIVHPIPHMINMDLSEIERFAQDWKKETERVGKNNWYKYQALTESLQEVVTKSITIKPYTRIQLLSVGFNITYESIKNDGEKELFKEIITLQTKLLRETYFDIGVELMRISRFFGIKY